MIRLFILSAASLLLISCAPKVTGGKRVISASSQKIAWPNWHAAQLPERTPGTEDGPSPQSHPLQEGIVISYGPKHDGAEEFLILGDRDELPPQDLGVLPIAFLPTSIFAGPSPLNDRDNTLRGPQNEHYTYPALHRRSSFFQTFPSLGEQAKGTIFYHTSIMMLSSAEAGVVKRFQKRGWNVLVALPSDSFYRSRLPAYLNHNEDPEAAAHYLAQDMDRHYHEQAQAAKVALAYLRKTRPSWLQGRQILMGTSGGSFSLPAVALKSPNAWDKIIFVSPGANLMTTYEQGAANIFPQTLSFIDTIRMKPPLSIRRIPTNEEYHAMYRRAAQLTQLHPGKLSPHLKKEDILFMNGSRDHILPKEEIEKAYLALGSPQRWTYPLGHHLVALNLLTQINRLDRWMTL